MLTKYTIAHSLITNYGILLSLAHGHDLHEISED